MIADRQLSMGSFGVNHRGMLSVKITITRSYPSVFWSLSVCLRTRLVSKLAVCFAVFEASEDRG